MMGGAVLYLAPTCMILTSCLVFMVVLCFAVFTWQMAFALCRTQAGLSQPSRKAPTTALPEVLLQLLINPLPHPLGVHRALGCYRVVLTVTPVPQRTAFTGSITSGQTFVGACPFPLPCQHAFLACCNLT